MMRLSTLWKVDRTLDDNARRSPLAHRIAEPWEPDNETLRFARSSANFVYRFRANGEECFLRFANAAERTREIIEAEIDLLEWLAGQGLSVTRPLRSKSGNRVETIHTEVGDFHAVAFAGLPGVHLKTDELDLPRFQDWGACRGRLHAALRTYSGLAVVTRPSWRDHLDWARAYIPANNSAI